MRYSTKKETELVGLPTFKTILADNGCRIGKFATRTYLAANNGKKNIYKTAITEEAQPFLKQIIKNERKNVDYLKPHFDVLCGILENNSIKYKYLPYQSLQDKIAFYLRKGNHAVAAELFKSYVDELYSLPRVTTVPEAFLTTIIEESDYDKTKMDCLSRGVLDLIPQNIFVNHEKWIVIDNEWSFDFPVPISFILYRAIRTLSVSLQMDIRKATSKENPSLGLFKLGFSIHYVPEFWIKSIGCDYLTISKMHQWEIEFQKYVVGEIYSINSLNIEPKKCTHFSMISMLMNMFKRRVRLLPVFWKLFYMLYNI